MTFDQRAYPQPPRLFSAGVSEFKAVLNCPAVAEIAPASVELISVPAAELAVLAPLVTLPCTLDAHDGGGADVRDPARAWMFWPAVVAFCFQVGSEGFGAPAMFAAYCTWATSELKRCLYTVAFVPAGVAVAAGGCVAAGAVVAVAIGTAVRVAVGPAGCVGAGACVDAAPVAPVGPADADVAIGGRVFAGVVVRLAATVGVVSWRIVGEFPSSPPMPNAT
jgi:hypothetical protein